MTAITSRLLWTSLMAYHWKIIWRLRKQRNSLSVKQAIVILFGQQKDSKVYIHSRLFWIIIMKLWLKDHLNLLKRYIARSYLFLSVWAKLSKAYIKISWVFNKNIMIFKDRQKENYWYTLPSAILLFCRRLMKYHWWLMNFINR